MFGLKIGFLFLMALSHDFSDGDSLELQLNLSDGLFTKSKCSQSEGIFIEEISVEKFNKSKEKCNEKKSCNNSHHIKPADNLLPIIFHLCNGKKDCSANNDQLNAVISTTYNDEIKKSYVSIKYRCKPICEDKLVWNINNITVEKEINKTFFMVLRSNNKERHKCNIEVQNHTAKIRILHLSFEGQDSYFSLHGLNSNITLLSFSQFINKGRNITSGQNLTMDIFATGGSLLWFEVQSSCGTRITCLKFTELNTQQKTGTFKRNCGTGKGKTTKRNDSSKATMILTEENISSTSTTLTSSTTELISSDISKTKTEFSSHSTISYSSSSKEAFDSNLTTKAYLTTIIVCTVMAVVLLFVITALAVLFKCRRNRKCRMVASIDQLPSEPYLDNTYTNPAVAYTEVNTYKTKNETTESKNIVQPGKDSSELVATPDNPIVSQPQDTYATVNKPPKSSSQLSNRINGSFPETSVVEVPIVFSSETEYSHLSSVRPKGPIETENVYNG